MKKIRNILIIIGVILFANYIIHLPMCVEDYANRDSGIYPAQSMCKHSTLTRNAVRELMSVPTLKFYISPQKADFIFDFTNIFFAIVNIPVYIWQFARSNINPHVPFYYSMDRVIYKKSKQMFGLLGGTLWIIRKRLLR